MSNLTNKTTAEPADHQDVVETVFALLRAAGAAPLPSGRLGADLFPVAAALAAGRRPRRGPRVSASHVSLEYSDADGHYRFGLVSPRGGYELVGAQPSCIKGKGSVRPL